jgi:hypothetical protein
MDLGDVRLKIYVSTKSVEVVPCDVGCGWVRESRVAC